MSDARHEAVEAIKRGSVGTINTAQAEAAFDALTKPRTGQECEVCEGRGGIEPFVEEHHAFTDCPVCSGSGTVTRGPIAVLVGTGGEWTNEEMGAEVLRGDLFHEQAMAAQASIRFVLTLVDAGSIILPPEAIRRLRGSTEASCRTYRRRLR